METDQLVTNTIIDYFGLSDIKNTLRGGAIQAAEVIGSKIVEKKAAKGVSKSATKEVANVATKSDKKAPSNLVNSLPVNNNNENNNNARTINNPSLPSHDGRTSNGLYRTTMPKIKLICTSTEP